MWGGEIENRRVIETVRGIWRLIIVLEMLQCIGVINLLHKVAGKERSLVVELANILSHFD